MKIKKQLWLWLALILVLLGIAKYATSSWRKYQVWEAHKTYFQKPLVERKIKIWMTPNFIKRHYDIDLTSLLGFSPGFWEERDSLDILCQKNQIDCDALVKNLNRHAKPPINPPAN